MLQQGQVFRLTSQGAEGHLWAYRHRTGGRASRRIQRGGFASEEDAREALERSLERLRRANGSARVLTLAELVEEYLAQHDGQPRIHAGQAALAADQVNRGVGSTCPLTELDACAGDRRLADDAPLGRTPLRSHPSPPADARARR